MELDIYAYFSGTTWSASPPHSARSPWRSGSARHVLPATPAQVNKMDSAESKMADVVLPNRVGYLPAIWRE